jgi:DNA invertase Pin-like site-specific DNA recombinase
MQEDKTRWKPTQALNSKVDERHLERLAMVYVRQSTPQQLSRHQESTRMHYGLKERALALGWPNDRVVVIDDDLGRSGTSTEGRPGFQRLVAEVGLDHVGIIFGIEMSRLARSCRDWHQLLEVCAVFGTLIADLDGVYDPSNYNDRLLLGLKGTMSEAELHVLKQRMLQGKMQKARRGELGFRPPTGYIRRASGEVIKDPDEQAQSVIEQVFDAFEARGTIHGVLRYLVEHGIQMPVRIMSGPDKGDLVWRRPHRVTVSNMLHNPAYTGAYVYGRRPVDPRRKKPGRPSTGRTVAEAGSWEVLLKDRFPAYISWEQYEANLEQLIANRAKALGTVRHGPALLSGLLRCGRCGARMTVNYSGGSPRYQCGRQVTDYAGTVCMSLAARVLDKRVIELVFQALEPSALEVSIQVAKDVEAERRRADEQWKLRLERAQYEVDRALRQYNSVEPENRLVARTFERQLEERLVAQQKLEQEHRRFVAQQPTPLSVEEREAIRALAADIPALWNASTTTDADRQMIIRQLVERIEVNVRGETELVDVVIQWAGGHRTNTSVVRPVARTTQLSYYKPLLERLVELRRQGLTSKKIAQQLNEEGWRPPKRRKTFSADIVRTMLSRNGLTKRIRQTVPSRKKRLRRDEWFLPELARELDMPAITLYNWLRRGWINGRQLLDQPHAPWVIRAEEAELSRLRALRAAPKIGWLATKPVAQA